MNLFNKLLFKTKVYTPEILIGTGISAAFASVVLACKATLKVNDLLVPVRERINDVKKYTPDELQEEKIKEIKKGLTPKIIKAYVPSAIFFGMSVSCIISSFHIQKGRELAMATAYATLKESYDAYRKRVEEKYGEQEDRDIASGKKEVKEVVGHDKKGKEICNIHYDYDDDPNNFKYLFDESNINWTPDVRENIYALATIQSNLNNRLKRRGYLYLYEVYKALGIDPGTIGPRKMQAARVVGWLYDPDNPNGDNYIDFGIFKDSKGTVKDYVADQMRLGEPSIWLEFNPDGDILTGDHGRRVFTETARGM